MTFDCDYCMIRAMNNTNINTIYLGIDGGGSTCRARLRGQDGQLLGSGQSGPANLRLGIKAVSDQILRCTQQALEQAGIGDYPLEKLHAGIGLAGAVLQKDKQATLALQRMFATCTLNQDAYIACLGAHGGQPGGVVIVGTGSCAQLISPALDRTFGGWGFALSDQASGAWLGRNALAYALQALEDIQASSSLCEDICSSFDHQPEQMLRWSDSATPAEYARFAPRIFQHAKDGDDVALSLLKDACTDLERLVAVLEKYNTGKISLLGGLADSYRGYLSDWAKETLRPARTDALDGALIMAGLPISTLEHT